MLYFLLIGLITLPLAGALLALITAQAPRLAAIAPLIQAAAALITLGIAWILRPAQFEMVIGNWSPISFTGTPLIIALNPEGSSIVIAIAAGMVLAPVVHDQGTSLGATTTSVRGIVAAAVFGALAVTALANSLVTLLVGIGLVDFLVALYGLLHSRQPGRVLRDAFFNGASLAFLAVAITLHEASGGSLYMPLAHLPERLIPFVMLALVLRFSLVPLRASADHVVASHWSDKASVIASLILVTRLPQLEAPGLRAWFYGLALLTAISTLIAGALTTNRHNLLGSIETGALALTLTAAVTWEPGTIAVATIAWLLGTALIEQLPSAYPAQARRVVQVARYVGAACLVGVPLTAGFITRAGVAANWADRGLGGAVLITGLALAQFLLALCVLRQVAWTEAPSVYESPGYAGYLASAMLVVLALHAVLFGLSPGLATAPGLGEEIARTGLIGWLAWLLPTLLGGAAWWYENRWVDYLVLARNGIISFVNLGWWQGILGGALRRIARPLDSIFVFLESDGALLWAVIVILVIVLVSRTGGP